MAAQEPTADGIALGQLAAGGADLSQVHRFDFTLRFPTQKAAERAEFQLIQLAFTPSILPGKAEGPWVVQGSKRMYPVESDLLGLRDKLNVIATEGRGTYVGWVAHPSPRPERQPEAQQ